MELPPFLVAQSEEKMKAFGNRIFESRADFCRVGNKSASSKGGVPWMWSPVS
jgi:hypothetical protein